MKQAVTVSLCLFLFIAALSGCSHFENSENAAPTTISTADTSGMDFSFDEEDLRTETTATADRSATPPDTSSTTAATAVQAEGTKTITAGGSYTFGGNVHSMIVVDAGNANVTLLLDGVTLLNDSGPCIYVRKANKVTITLAAGTTNTVSDGSSYTITDSGSTLDAAIFSKTDLTINGSGTLVVTGNYKHGIVSKDDLVIASGTLQITSQNVGLNGRDCVKVNNGAIAINAGSDGIRSDNAEDTSKGYVYLSGGSLNITAGNDGIQAETVIKIDNTELTIAAGGGSSGYLSSSSESHKGLKAASDIYIDGGTLRIDSKDDCIHSNGTIAIEGGTYTLSSGDDGVHADTDLAISGSATTLHILKSYEGIEATNIVISNGTIRLVAEDDGLNAAGGNNASSGGSSRPGMGHFSASNGSIVITGGDIYIEMDGDGIDANGTLSITGGNITIAGANRGDTSILDFDSTGTIGGGTFIGTGATGMAQNFSSSSAQGVILLATGSQQAGTTVTLTDSSGKTLLSHTAKRDYSCVIISISAITKGNSYTLTAGTYSKTVTMNNLVYGSSGSGMGGGFGGRW